MAPKSMLNERRKGESIPVKYHRGVKQPPVKKAKLTRNVVNKTFETDDDLNSFILQEGTLKDRVSAMSLLAIKERNEKAARMLLSMAAEERGGDKSFLALTNAVKVAQYYEECKKDVDDSKTDKKDKTNLLQLNGKKEESQLFCEFIHKINFVKGLFEAISAQMSSSFLRTKIAVLLRTLIEDNTLAVHAVNILMDHTDITITRETEKIIEILVEKENKRLLDIIKEKIVQGILYNRNRSKIKHFMALVLSIHRDQWFSTPQEYKEYIVPLIRGYISELKKFHEEINNPKVKNKHGFSGLASLLLGLFRFIQWERVLPADTFKETRASKIMSDAGYIIFKMAYHENTKYSFPALNILEAVNDVTPINYARVLADTVKKYIYLNELSKCEVLNKAVNQPEKEVQEMIIKSAYHSEINGKYSLGCEMVTQECVPEPINRIGYYLLQRSYDKEVSAAAKDLLQNKPIKVYNIWS